MNQSIDYGMMGGEIWFRGKDIASILGYVDTEDKNIA